MSKLKHYKIQIQNFKDREKFATILARNGCKVSLSQEKQYLGGIKYYVNFECEDLEAL
jgi:hypothetical protein